MRRLRYPTIETRRLTPAPTQGKQPAILPQPPGYNLGSNPQASTKTLPPYHRRASVVPQQLHPELARTQGLYPKMHVANAGQASSVVYSYPTGVAQFYFWYRKLLDDQPYTMFWPGNKGFGAPSRRLAQNQARATIWGSAPTTTNTSLRALIAQAGANS